MLQPQESLDPWWSMVQLQRVCEIIKYIFKKGPMTLTDIHYFSDSHYELYLLQLQKVKAFITNCLCLIRIIFSAVNRLKNF